MRSSIMVRMLAVAGLAWLLVLPAAAAAYPMTGKCSLALTSTDASGSVLDTIKSGDESGSAEDPFLVDWRGTVRWEGQSQVALKDNHYHVALFGMATPFQGEASNSADLRNTAGAFGFTANAPFAFTGTYYISAGIIAANGSQCSGTFVVKLIGEPIGTVPFFVGLALLAIGALLLAWGFAGHLGAAISGGVVLGLGASLEAVIFSVLPLGGLTPVAVVGSGIVLAAISAIVGGRRLRRLERALAAQVAAEGAAGPELAPVVAPADAAEPAESPEAEPHPAEEPAESPEAEPHPAQVAEAGLAAAGPEPVIAELVAEPAGDADMERAHDPGPAAVGAPRPVRPPDDPWPATDLAPQTTEAGTGSQGVDKA